MVLDDVGVPFAIDVRRRHATISVAQCVALPRVVQNRLDDIIIFDILSPLAIRKIVDIQVGQVKERLLSKNIYMDIKDGVLDYLSKEGYNPQYGARPLKRLIQTKILNPIASLMISQGISSGGTIIIGVKNNEFTFDVKKGKRNGNLVKEPIDIEE